MSEQKRNTTKNQICLGLLAHVDAGKTTLSEAMLYEGGQLRRLGRVDHQDAFLDTDVQERERGITIFSKQAVLPLEHTAFTLLDTPGHVDFSSEMERTLQVLDYAVLVISGTDGVQSHTRTLWRLLERYNVPTFLFINKMDLDGADHDKVLAELQKLSTGCVDFTSPEAERDENIAVCDEDTLAHYLETGEVECPEIKRLIKSRKLFPCWFGSALKLDGVKELLNGLEMYTEMPEYPKAFGAKVFKIAHDNQGARLTYLKVTGGALPVKMVLKGGAGENVWAEKADQLRIYSGGKFRLAEEVTAGGVCTVTGLTHTYPGQGLGAEEDTPAPVLESFLTYQVFLPDGMEPHTAVRCLRVLEEEDPQLHVVWNEQLHEIHVQIMGAVQLEVLQRVLKERFKMEVTFGTGSIVYRETIEEPVEGMGHFEPLRHYAEVHLLLEPGERGSGMRFGTVCSMDVLDRNWQNLILTHLEERSYPGVLTGSPITDMKITLLIGRAHLKHTEGGDFRQATYRALRQGLMRAQNVLLEPVYSFRLEIPQEQIGRAMTDIQRMNGTFEPPQTEGEFAILCGSAPVACMRGYQQEVTSYSRGRGKLFCTLQGYAACHNAEEVMAAAGYDPEADLENPPSSVFCAHGAGFVVPWDQVEDYMHLEAVALPSEKGGADEKEVSGIAQSSRAEYFVRERKETPETFVSEEELEEIFKRTYYQNSEPKSKKGYQKRYREEAPPRRLMERSRAAEADRSKPRERYLLVDGYNIIFSWEMLRELSKVNIESARNLLMDVLCDYQGFNGCTLILVFDAYRVEGGREHVFNYHNIHVVFTREAETADQYIEKTVHKIGKKADVTVATSDALEQVIIYGQGARRMAARELLEEVELTREKVLERIEKRPGSTQKQPTENDHNYLFDHLPEELVSYMEEVRLGKREL